MKSIVISRAWGFTKKPEPALRANLNPHINYYGNNKREYAYVPVDPSIVIIDNLKSGRPFLVKDCFQVTQDISGDIKIVAKEDYTDRILLFAGWQRHPKNKVEIIDNRTTGSVVKSFKINIAYFKAQDEAQSSTGLEVIAILEPGQILTMRAYDCDSNVSIRVNDLFRVYIYDNGKVTKYLLSSKIEFDKFFNSRQ